MCRRWQWNWITGGYQRGFAGDGKPAAGSADKLLRYKGMLWIDGEPNRHMLFEGRARSRLGRTVGQAAPQRAERPFIGDQLPEDERIKAAFAGLKGSNH